MYYAIYKDTPVIILEHFTNFHADHFINDDNFPKGILQQQQNKLTISYFK